MSDLFEREAKVLEEAKAYCKTTREEQVDVHEKYAELTREYGRLLRQLRRVTKLTDRTTDQLNTDRLQLMDEVNYDAMTGIYNRRYLEASLPEVMENACVNGDVLSVLMIDVDFFKKYNDRYGHSAGDDCLKKVAGAIASRVGRRGDYVARYGGEEFTVVLPSTDESGARVIASCILEIVKGLALTHEGSTVADCVTVSIGVTSAVVEADHTPLMYLQRADVALYQAKQGGRDRYVYLAVEEE